MTGREFLQRNPIYQVYPASFSDGDGDGFGDLQGLIERLDYIDSLGVGAIWLGPIYPSPMVDMGYDVSDYKGVDPRYGKLADFDRLIAECNKRQIKVIMDLVVNHTSNQHPWFQEALRDPSSKYRDYYIFRPGKGKKGKRAPNNWTTAFQTSAWTRLPDGQYYLHLYAPEQPDLNWTNPAVLAEVEDIMRFWMDRGVFGFRMDVISEIYKTSFEDGGRMLLAEMELPRGHEHFIAQPGCHAILKKLRQDVIEPRGGVLIGECFGVDSDEAKAFMDGELDAVISFDLMKANGLLSNRPARPARLEKILREWQTSDVFSANYFENHDQHRSVGKLVPLGADREGASEALLTLLFSLKGGIIVYQGEELGAVDYPKLKYEESHDVVARNMYSFFRKFIPSKRLAWRLARSVGRDDPRAPMAFIGYRGHGFTDPDVTPWQKFNPTSDAINVDHEEKSNASVLGYFRRLVVLRYSFTPLYAGSVEFLDGLPDGMIGLVRRAGDEASLTLVNLSTKAQNIPDEVLDMPRVLVLSNTRSDANQMEPFGAAIYRIVAPERR